MVEKRKTLVEILQSQDFDQLQSYKEPSKWKLLTHDEKELLAKLLVMHGSHLLKNGDKMGLETFKTAREVSSRSPTILYAQSEELSSHKESIHCLQEASLLLKEVLSKNPHYFNAQYLLAGVFLDIALFEEELPHFIAASKEFEKGLELIPEVDARAKGDFFWKFGVCLREMGKVSGEPLDFYLAIQKFRESYSENSDKTLFLNDFGLSLVELAFLIDKREYLVEACDLFAQGAIKDPGDFDSWYYQGYCLLRLLEWKVEKHLLTQAEYCFNKAAKIRPNDDALWYQFGSLDLLSGKIEHDINKIKASVVKFSKAHEIDPLNPVVLNCFAEAELLVGSKEENLEFLESARNKIVGSLEIHPKDSRTWYLYGSYFIELGKYYSEEEYFHVAIKKFQEGLSVSNQNPLLYYGLALAYFALGEMFENVTLLEKATHFCSKAVECDSEGFSQFWNDWGVILLRIGEITEQPSVIKEAIVKFEQALKNFFQTGEIAQVEIEWLYNYGCAFDLLGEVEDEASYFEKAVLILQQAVKLDPHYNRARYNLALAHAHLGEISQDIEAYQKGIEQFQYLLGVDPEDDMVHMDYGVLLTHLGLLIFEIHLSERSHFLYGQAEHHYMQAISLGNVQAYYHLAGLYSITGHLDQSMHYLEKAKQSENFPPIEDVLHDEWLENLRRQPRFWQFIKDCSSEASEEK